MPSSKDVCFQEYHCILVYHCGCGIGCWKGGPSEFCNQDGHPNQDSAEDAYACLTGDVETRMRCPGNPHSLTCSNYLLSHRWSIWSCCNVSIPSFLSLNYALSLWKLWVIVSISFFVNLSWRLIDDTIYSFSVMQFAPRLSSFPLGRYSTFPQVQSIGFFFYILRPHNNLYYE